MPETFTSMLAWMQPNTMCIRILLELVFFITVMCLQIHYIVYIRCCVKKKIWKILSLFFACLLLLSFHFGLVNVSVYSWEINQHSNLANINSFHVWKFIITWCWFGRRCCCCCCFSHGNPVVSYANPTFLQPWTIWINVI